MGQPMTASFRVVVQLGWGVSATSPEIEIAWGASPTATPTPTATPAPYIATARNVSISSSGLIRWDASSRAAGGYRVRYMKDAGTAVAVNVGAGSDSYRIPNFAQASASQVTVSFLNANGSLIQGTRGAAVWPHAPTGLRSTALDSTRISLSWNASTGANRYRVETSRAGANRQRNVTTETTYLVGYLLCNTSYDVAVEAGRLTDSGIVWSAPSAKTSVTTAACPLPGSNKVRNLRIAADGVIVWDAPTGAVGGYRVRYRQGNSGAWTSQDVGLNANPPRRLEISNFSRTNAYQARVGTLVNRRLDRSSWSDTVNYAHPTFAPFQENLGPAALMGAPNGCLGATPIRSVSDEGTTSTRGGYSHAAGIHALFGGDVQAGLDGTQCYFMSATNRSSPGASESSFDGEISTSNLVMFPNEKETLNAACDQPCAGATWQSAAIRLSVDQIVHQAYKIHIKGTHTFAVGTTTAPTVKTQAEGVANTGPFGGG